MTKINVRLIVGGASTAHDASLMMYAAMTRSIGNDGVGRVAVTRVYYVARSGAVRFWKIREEDVLPDVAALDAGVPLTTADYLADIAAGEEFIFSLLQGTDGEDGVYQGLLKVAKVLSNLGPVFPAALSRHKWSQSLVAEFLCPELTPIPTLRLRPDASDDDLEAVARHFGNGDVVVKPNDLGGSVHTRVLERVSPAALRAYLAVARDYADEFLVQARLVGREFTVGCMRVSGKTIVLPVVEVKVASGFLGFTEKWSLDSFRSLVLPENDAISKRLSPVSARLFDELGFGFACRFDFIVADEAMHFLEANSKPGLCGDSFFTVMLAHSGRSLCDFLLLSHKDALSQWQRHTQIDYQLEFEREAKERSATAPGVDSEAPVDGDRA
jgi:D-alanine-D-alanine ligase